MWLKTITLTAAVTQSLALICGIINFCHNFSSGGMNHSFYVVTAPFGFMAQISMILFLILFYKKQKV